MIYSKKILFIDATLHRKDATGITLSNLFGSWPKENLYMIGNYEMIQLSREEGYEGTYILDDTDYYHRFPLGYVLRLRQLVKGKRIFAVSKGTSKFRTNSLKSEAVNIKITLSPLFSFLFQKLGIEHLFFRQIISNGLREWIERTDPDFFYAVLSTRHSILFAEKLMNEFKKPLFIHILDDWPSTIGNSSFLYDYWNFRINNEFKRLQRLSHRRIAISKKMANEYAAKYNNNWSYFHNPIDLALWKPFQKSHIDRKTGVIKIAYFGRFGRSNDEAIIDFTMGVKLFNAQNFDNYTIEFHLFTNLDLNVKQKIGFNDSEIILHPFILNEEVPKEISNYDFLLLPISFSERDLKFARLSMPTKFSEYLISGVPVILFAPRTIAVTEFSEENNCTFILDVTTAKEICEKLFLIIKDTPLQNQLSSRAKFIAERKFSSLVIHESFRQLFR